MIRRHMIAQMASYSRVRPYHATYQVVRGIKTASMASNWCRHINQNYHGWEFDLRELQAVDMVDFRLTSDVGEWQGRLPRNRMPAMFISFGATPQGDLKLTGRYARYFQKVA